MNFKSLFVTLCYFGIVGCVQSNSHEGLELTGRISMKGTVPHSFIALREEKSGRLYKILYSDKYNIEKYQNRILTLSVKIVKKERGIGFPAEVEVQGIRR